MKPYNEQYYEKQLKDFNSKIKTFHNTPEGFMETTSGDTKITIGNVTLKYVDETFGRMDGYLYKNFTRLENFPVLFENNQLWMSITPMEIDSHWIPIELANGNVGVAGLGLGYYIQNILDKPNVDSVTVFEINQDIIDLYLKNFGTHDKLTIIKEDILTKSAAEFDFFYNDIYPNLFDSKAIKDSSTILENNVIDEYFFWGMEGFIITAMSRGYTAGVSKTLLSKFIELYDCFLNSEYHRMPSDFHISEEDINEFLLLF